MWKFLSPLGCFTTRDFSSRSKIRMGSRKKNNEISHAKKILKKPDSRVQESPEKSTIQFVVVKNGLTS